MEPLRRPPERVFPRRRSREQIVAENAPQSGDAIAPSDFFSFRVASAGIRNGHFVDAPVSFGDLGRAFGLKSEAVRFEANALQDFAAENLVASLHIGQLQIRKDIREQ